MAFSFNELNLSGVEVSTGGGTLQPGRHVCKISDAVIKDTRTGGKQLEVQLDSVKGGGIRAWINVHVPASQDATRIGREQLKALLVHGGHPNPDRPGDVASMKGLTVGVAVKSDSYEKNGETRTGSRVHYFFDPSEEGHVKGSQPASKSGGMELDDAIPF